MIRYYASIATIKTTEGLLPQSLYRADNDCVEGRELLSDPLRREVMKEPFWRFMAASGDKGTFLSECSRGVYDRWVQLSNKAIAEAKSPPVKNAKIAMNDEPKKIYPERCTHLMNGRAYYYLGTRNGTSYGVCPDANNRDMMISHTDGCYQTNSDFNLKPPTKTISDTVIIVWYRSTWSNTLKYSILWKMDEIEPLKADKNLEILKISEVTESFDVPI